jgi:hypothetical protein
LAKFTTLQDCCAQSCLLTSLPLHELARAVLLLQLQLLMHLLQRSAARSAVLL